MDEQLLLSAPFWNSAGPKAGGLWAAWRGVEHDLRLTQANYSRTCFGGRAPVPDPAGNAGMSLSLTPMAGHGQAKKEMEIEDVTMTQSIPGKLV